MQGDNQSIHTKPVTPACTCTLCGKQYDFWDKQESFNYESTVGYGSKYDLTLIRVRLCCDCFDKFIDYIVDHGKYNPIAMELE